MTRTSWIRRAQRNRFAVVPFIYVPKGWPDKRAEYEQAAYEEYVSYQQWFHDQLGETIKVLPAVSIVGTLTAEELRGGWEEGLGFPPPTPYMGALADLRAQPVYDVEGELVDPCNWLRVFPMYQPGATGLGNNGGRSSWGCAAAPDNPLEPWGPGWPHGLGDLEIIAGGLSWAPSGGLNIALIGGAVTLRTDTPGLYSTFTIPTQTIALPNNTRVYAYIDNNTGAITVARVGVTHLTANVAAGATQVQVNDASFVTLNGWYSIANVGGDGNFEWRRVTNIAGTTLTLHRPLFFAHSGTYPTPPYTLFSTEKSPYGPLLWDATTVGGAITAYENLVARGRGAVLHEFGHCLGFQHGTVARDGPEATSSVMWINYNYPNTIFTTYERAQARGGTGSHFFK